MLNINAIGNLGKDPERKQLGDYPAVGFSLGIKTGKDQTTWINCTMFGENKAELILNSLKKGSKIAVSGKGNLRKYEAQDGSERSSFDLTINDFTFLDKKPANQAEDF